MPITVTFDPPQPSDSPAVFNSKAFSTLGNLNTWSGQANALPSEAAASATAAANAVLDGKMNAGNPSYTGTLTGGTGVVNLGSGQFVKDAAGNIGVGATPSAWHSLVRSVAVGRAGTNVYGFAGSNISGLTANAIFDASDWKYVTSDYATRYQTNGGGHFWYTAPSGTAGNPITFTQAMTLDASGNLAINGLTATGAINLQGSSTFPTTGMFLRSGDNQLKIIAGSAGIAFGSQSGASTLATLDASGNLIISGKLQAGATAPGAFDMARFSGTNATANDLTLYGPSTSQVRVQFSRSGGSGIGEIGYDMATDTMRIVTGGSGRVAVDSSGNLTVNAGLIGYGTGAGGTVTQVTSKATAVTLNKQSGRITMHGAALAANTQVEFVFNNSYVSSTDAVLIHPSDGSLGHFYEVQTYFAGSGSAHIRVRNISAGSRSDALTLQFTVIKGSTT